MYVGLPVFYSDCITANQSGLILDREVLMRTLSRQWVETARYTTRDTAMQLHFSNTMICLNAPVGGGVRAARITLETRL